MVALDSFQDATINRIEIHLKDLKMPHDTALERIEKKLDRLVSTQNDLKISAAKYEEQEKSHQKNIDRFWGSTWPDVVEKIDGNSTKIATLEVEIAKIKTKVMVWGSLITVLVALSIPFITYYLDKE